MVILFILTIKVGKVVKDPKLNISIKTKHEEEKLDIKSNHEDEKLDIKCSLIKEHQRDIFELNTKYNILNQILLYNIKNVNYSQDIPYLPNNVNTKRTFNKITF